MKYKRSLSKVLTTHAYSTLVLGPRQTGKSTLLRAMKPDVMINLADEHTFLEYAADPGRLRALIGNLRGITILLDEVQRLPNLLNTVQALIDEDNGRYRFLLSGSSARKLRRGSANLLPGRIMSYNLSPLHLLEITDQRPMKELLSLGTLPGILTEPDLSLRKKLLSTYAATYLKEEIQAEALTKNIEGFSRFLISVAAKNGEFIDYAKLGSQASITQKTSSRFFEVLEDTLIVKRLTAFASSESRRLVQHPKFYFFDTGVLNGLLGNFTVSSDRIGVLFETFVFNQISAAVESHGGDARISSYRTAHGSEIDFILELAGQVIAIEVKASHNVGSSDLKALNSFVAVHPAARAIVIYLGEDELERDGVRVVPLANFLKQIVRLVRK